MARGIIKGAGILACVCLIAMLGLIFANVILRYAVGTPLYWGDEMMINLMMIMAYAGFGFLLAEGGHIRVTFIFDKMHTKAQNVLWVIAGLLGVGYAGYLLYAMTLLVLDSLAMRPFSMITRWPNFPWQMVIGLGLFALLVAFLRVMADRVSIVMGSKKTGEKTKGKDEILKIHD